MNNRFDSPEMLQLRAWAEEGVIKLRLTEISEGRVASSSKSHKNRLNIGIVYPLRKDLLAHPKYDPIRQVLFGDKELTKAEQNDVLIAISALTWAPPLILLTYDGASKSQPKGFLGCKTELAKHGLSVMHPADAVALVSARL